MNNKTTSFVSQLFALVLVLGISSGLAVAGPSTQPLGPRLIMIIRHAEKPAPTGGEKNPNLSDQGYLRADALAATFPIHFPKPDFLIATKRSKGSNRPAETITPLSRILHEPIESDFADDDVAGVAKEVLTNPKYAGKVVLIAWHHGKIPDLAKALGVHNAPQAWDSKVFDRVWSITYENGAVTWKNLPQKAMPGDNSEK